MLRDGIRGEQTYEHNVLVVSSSRISRNSRTVIVAPITTSHRDVPWLVEVEPQDAGIDRRSWIECDQLKRSHRLQSGSRRQEAAWRPRSGRVSSPLFATCLRTWSTTRFEWRPPLAAATWDGAAPRRDVEGGAAAVSARVSRATRWLTHGS